MGGGSARQELIGLLTDWQSYNFEDRMPDVIYIHNAYDNCNRVTSVHSKFYSGNLKKYTEKLVYIPYFVYRKLNRIIRI